MGDLNGKLGPLPVWAWALMAGGGVGLVFFLRSRGAPPPAAQATPDDSNPTTIVPYPGAGGLTEAQWQQLMNAINALHGPASTTPPPGTINGGLAPINRNDPGSYIIYPGPYQKAAYN